MVGSDGAPRYRVEQVADAAAIMVLGYGTVDVKTLDPSSRALVINFAQRLGVSPRDSAERLQAKAKRYFSKHPLPQELVESLERLFRDQLALGARRARRAHTDFARFVGDRLGPVARSTSAAAGTDRKGEQARQQVNGLVGQMLERKQKAR